MYTYVVEHDYGFAPNPFFGTCTLATCKPRIRAKADVGDLILAAGSKKFGLDENIVFHMFVGEICTFDEYWNNKRFFLKRPEMSGSIMRAVGDNIYRHKRTGAWSQQHSLHRRTSDKVDAEHLGRDTSSDRVLIGHDFIYWGGDGPRIPSSLLTGQSKKLVGGRPVRCKFSDLQIAATVRWLRSFQVPKIAGRPRQWIDLESYLDF